MRAARSETANPYRRSLLKRTQSIETRAAIVRAALALWAKTGIEGPTVEEICRAAGIGRSTFYLHFETKQQLLSEAAWQTARATADDVAKAAVTGDLDDQIAAFVDGVARRIEKLPRDFVAVVLRHAHDAGDTSARRKEGQPHFAPILAGVLGRGRGDGSLRADTDVVEVAEVLSGVTQTALLRWSAAETGKTALRKTLATGFELVLDGLRTSPTVVPGVPSDPKRLDGSTPPAGRGRPRALSTDRIADAAVRLARRVGLAQVSMRMLADELGVPLTTVYNYAANKDALDELVANRLLSTVQVPGPDEGTWEQRLKKLERDCRDVMKLVPGLSLERRGLREGTRLADGVMTILDGAGFAPGDVHLAFSVLLAFMVGQLDIDADVASTRGPAGMAVQASARAAGRSPDEMFELGLDVVLEGLKATFARRPPPVGHRR
ncbi:MAG: TetR/AcrR family transcriptional regulator [Acidimicrobiia bacterium]